MHVFILIYITYTHWYAATARRLVRYHHPSSEELLDAYRYKYMYLNIYIYIHVYTHTYIYTYIYTYIHMYVCILIYMTYTHWYAATARCRVRHHHPSSETLLDA